MNTPSLTRRDALKIGAFGAAAVSLPLATKVSAGSISTLSSSKLVPYKTAFSTPPLAQSIPVGDARRPLKWRNADVDYYRLEQKEFTAQILAGVNTKLFGYNGHVPGPTIRVN